MSIPGFNAEASLGRASGQYVTWLSGTAVDRGTSTAVVPAQLPTCGVGAICLNPDVGVLCNCPPGTTCKKRRPPPICYRQCFLWWCWTRCEPSQIWSYDSF